MQNTELLHRFFDEGLEEPLEDVLFGQMALDPELRREFTAHLKLHSIIQEDVAGITTPSHVSQQLFTTLGLTPPVETSFGTAQRLRRGAGAAMLLLRSRIVEHRKYLYTAALSAIATAVLVFGLMSPGGTPATTERQPSADEGRATHEEVTTPAQKIVSTGEDRSPQAAGQLPAILPPAVEPPAVEQPAAVQPAAAAPVSLADGNVPAPRSLALLSSLRHPAEELENLRLENAEVEISEVPAVDPPWKFFQPGPQTSFLSNLVFELRKYYGTSYPDVDLPHNSHKVFENMAISVIYKATEHHAFGFEYGRESFGREYERTDVESAPPLVLDQSVQRVFEPPSQWITGPQRENRMLDLVGAVWKLSLPEYGLFDVVYPYLRTFVGATKIGPLGKVRAGLEMYPSNFSMLNVGIEGGMLRYTVDDMSYYTTKLNFTFGVAIGF